MNCYVQIGHLNLCIETPVLVCKDGIEKSETGKFSMNLIWNENSNWSAWFNQLDKWMWRNVSSLGFSETFLDSVKKTTEMSELKIKLPYRYKKFEFITRDVEGFPVNILEKLKPNTLVKAQIELKNIWKIGNCMGPLWILKGLTIVS